MHTPLASLLLFAGANLFHGGMTMLKAVSAAVFGLFLITSSAAMAAPRDGSNELMISGGFFHQEGSDDGSLNVDLSYGYYLTPGWQLGIRQALNSTFREDARDFWQATTAPFINYNIRLTDIIVPYVGAFIGAVWNDNDISGIIGPQAGVKFFVHNTAFLNLGYRYEFFFSRFESIDDNSSRGNHVFNIGVGFHWGGR
jgi:hypothetical protein